MGQIEIKSQRFEASPLYQAIILFTIMHEGHNEVITDRPINPASSCQLPQSASTKNEPNIPIYTDLRINADDQSSCKVATYWLIIVAAIVIVALLSSLALPHSVLQKDEMYALKGTSLEGCTSQIVKSKSQLVCAQGATSLLHGQLVTNLQPLNQFVVFYLNVSLNGQPKRFDQKLYFKLYKASREVTGNGSITFDISTVLKQQQVNLISAYSGQEYFYIDYKNDMQSQQQFYWQIQLKLSSKLNDYKYSLESFVINPQYSIFCITIRITFILISAVFLLITYRFYLKVTINRLTPQHKFVVLLSIMTIAFNDPLYLATVFSPNAFTAFISTFFMWNFITYLFVSWVFFLKRILEQQGRLVTHLITCPNIFVASLFYLINMTFRVSLAIEQASNRPFTDPNFADDRFIRFFFGLSTMTTLAGIFYIFFLYCQLWQRRDSLLWRNKLFINISFFFFLVVFLIFLKGGYNIFEYSASTFMLTFTFTNIYSFFLQIMYMPVKNQPFGVQHNQKEAEIGGFDETDISIELQYQGYDMFYDYGASKLSEEEEIKVARSYLGENLQAQGSKITLTKTIKQSEQDRKSQVQQKTKQQQDNAQSIRQEQRSANRSIEAKNINESPLEQQDQQQLQNGGPKTDQKKQEQWCQGLEKQ